jgi:CxxC-x17-CxxC domain-containing protein
MPLQDKTLNCKDCGKEFDFTVREQEFYAEKGFENEPQRCKECRIAKKNAGRKEYPATCADCGQETTVPFEPRGDSPVYCRDCFKKQQ